ncbi:glutamate synthase subunit beta [Fulvivirga lutea]|uniref:Glutamate synthase subunit beta n=1 Tax=Fulvivirga lutea TaxID=2810512 RepID=A0A974WJ42_9BACT|nr:glutamate synthase subunit beta [Fulvivirga lutea]QSE98869.1 glutamate synthase subunit beta [Fulvivirga lutea]
MGKVDGFLKYDRELPKSRPADKRTDDFKEIYEEFPEQKTREQAARCMDCGIPFCHKGCPLGNIIPEFNDAVYREHWDEAIELLLSTNNFPEFTGRICPAPCEASCVLGINKPPVAIEHIEKTIAEKAYDKGYITPNPPLNRTGKTVAVIGSGPAGLAAADQLNKAGHTVTVFERDDRIGGLLRYGIPDFKLEKWVVERRVKLLEEEGIIFITNCEIGKDKLAAEVMEDFDVIVICTGSTIPRDLNIPGRNAKGVHFAMEFLTQQNKKVSGDTINPKDIISAKDRHVVVIGGGDTGSDCIGTSHRQGAKSVVQLELMPKPLNQRTDKDPWPLWPMTLRTSSSHEEGGERKWSVLTKEFVTDEHGQVKELKLVPLEWIEDKNGKKSFEERTDQEYTIKCDLALLAVGFTAPEKGVLDQFNVKVAPSGIIRSNNYKTNRTKIFTAGDARRGQSLVVWAISEGREAAYYVDEFLMGSSNLERKSNSITALENA